MFHTKLKTIIREKERERERGVQKELIPII
jgi:hypothetical protein